MDATSSSAGISRQHQCTPYVVDGYVAHEAAHRQILASLRTNGWSARRLGPAPVGINDARWTRKHSRHHAHPHMIGMDPDVHTGAIAFHPEASASRQGSVDPRWIEVPILVTRLLPVPVPPGPVTRVRTFIHEATGISTQNGKDSR
ncbi:fatty acid desaturase [Specibacter cremeus]|uniref:fatty acid desaturase n=1 Tax=Specibacter cremeus TaxID=1629051 RepID=UPI000F76A2F8|nr:fatty acid desaturase [Specibacter cremeus]